MTLAMTFTNLDCISQTMKRITQPIIFEQRMRAIYSLFINNKLLLIRKNFARPDQVIICINW